MCPKNKSSLLIKFINSEELKTIILTYSQFQSCSVYCTVESYLRWSLGSKVITRAKTEYNQNCPRKSLRKTPLIGVWYKVSQYTQHNIFFQHHCWWHVNFFSELDEVDSHHLRTMDENSISLYVYIYLNHIRYEEA